MIRPPSIRNWKSTPPNGGWSLTYHPPERLNITIDAQGHSPEQVLDKIHAWRLNNSLPKNEEEVFQWANAQWCARDPIRCLSDKPVTPQEVAGASRKTLTPEDYGRALWLSLNTHPVHFSKANFIAAIDHIKALLNPHNPHNHGSGCPACHLHFFEFNSQYPPTRVTTEIQCSVWIWMAHDNANLNAGKPHRPSYNLCAAIFGWEQLDTGAFEKARLSLLTPHTLPALK